MNGYVNQLISRYTSKCNIKKSEKISWIGDSGLKVFAFCGCLFILQRPSGAKDPQDVEQKTARKSSSQLHKKITLPKKAFLGELNTSFTSFLLKQGVSFSRRKGLPVLAGKEDASPDSDKPAPSSREHVIDWGYMRGPGGIWGKK